jgi:hypothetical protein
MGMGQRWDDRNSGKANSSEKISYLNVLVHLNATPSNKVQNIIEVWIRKTN